MIKVEIDSVSMRGNTPVLVMELALAMKSLRESLAKRYGEVATEELISRAMEASKAEGDINEIMSDLIDDVLFKILPKANINKDNIREMPQALKEVLRKMLEDMIMLAIKDAFSKIDKETESKLGSYASMNGLF